jgi:hypothetical protein
MVRMVWEMRWLVVVLGAQGPDSKRASTQKQVERSNVTLTAVLRGHSTVQSMP